MAQSPVEPWDRQGGESPQVFEAFAAFRDFGPARSITKVVQQLGKSRPLLSRWPSQYAWVMRASAYDREQVRTSAVSSTFAGRLRRTMGSCTTRCRSLGRSVWSTCRRP